MAGPAATKPETDWIEGQPPPVPPGRPKTIPPDAQGPPVIAPSAQTYGSRSAEPQREYVAGQPFPFLSNYLKALPHYIDDLTRDFGSDLYERMMLDPMTFSSVTLLKLSVLADGYEVMPAIEDKEDPDYEEAKEYADFCHRCLLGLEGETFEQFCFEILAGMELGHKVAEQVYRNGVGEDEGMLMLKALKVKPREAIGFVVDAYLNVVGLLGLIPGQGFPVLVGSIIANPSVLPNLLPREKFVVFTYNMKNNDIRGNAILRPVYNPWWLKQQTWPEYLRYLSVYACPSLIGTAGPESTTMPPSDYLGNPTGAATLTPEQIIANALAGLRNASACGLPPGTTVTIVQAQGNGEAFKSAIDLYDAQICQGILFQTLATMEGEHMARASSETHKDVLDLVIQHVKSLLQAVVRGDIFKPLIRYNHGDDVAARLTPKIAFGQTNQSDWHVDAASIAALVTSKFLSPSQFPALDERLGLPARTDDSLAEQEAKVAASSQGASASPDGAEAGEKTGASAPPEPGDKASPKPPAPESKNKENSPKSAAFSRDRATWGIPDHEIRRLFGINDADESRTRVLRRAFERIEKLGRRRKLQRKTAEVAHAV